MARGDSTGPAEPTGSAGGPRPAARGAAGGGGTAAADAAGPSGRTGSAATSRLAWIALAVAGVLTAWQVIYALTSPTTLSPETFSSVSLLLTLVLSVGAIVLGIVALGQGALPRWPATAATAVGAFAFIVCVATWIGTLMT